MTKNSSVPNNKTDKGSQNQYTENLVSYLAFVEKTYKNPKTKIMKLSQNAKDHKTWTTIYQHSMAKLSKCYAEQCFAPNPLPEEVSLKLNNQIENSRDLLLEILFKSEQMSEIA